MWREINKICVIIIIHQFDTTKHPKIIYTKNLNNVDIKQKLFEHFETMIKEPQYSRFHNNGTKRFHCNGTKNSSKGSTVIALKTVQKVPLW